MAKIIMPSVVFVTLLLLRYLDDITEVQLWPK